MQIERTDHGQCGADRVANLVQPVAIEVGFRVVDGGAVRGDEQPIERPGREEFREHSAYQRLRGSAFDRAARHRPRGENRHRVDALVRELGEEAADFVVRVGQPLADRGAGQEEVFLEPLQRR